MNTFSMREINTASLWQAQANSVKWSYLRTCSLLPFDKLQRWIISFNLIDECWENFLRTWNLSVQLAKDICEYICENSTLQISRQILCVLLSRKLSFRSRTIHLQKTFETWLLSMKSLASENCEKAFCNIFPYQVISLENERWCKL